MRSASGSSNTSAISAVGAFTKVLGEESFFFAESNMLLRHHSCQNTRELLDRLREHQCHHHCKHAADSWATDVHSQLSNNAPPDSWWYASLERQCHMLASISGSHSSLLSDKTRSMTYLRAKRLRGIFARRTCRLTPSLTNIWTVETTKNVGTSWCQRDKNVWIVDQIFRDLDQRLGIQTVGKGCSCLVGARGFHTDPTPQTAAVAALPHSLCAPCMLAARGPALLTSHPPIRSLLLHQIRSAIQRRVHRGRTHPFVEPTSTPNAASDDGLPSSTPVSIASLTSSPKGQLTSGSGVFVPSIHFLASCVLWDRLSQHGCRRC